MSSGIGETYIGKLFHFRKSGRHVTVQSVIGEGGFSLVFLVVSQSGDRYALKRMCVNNQSDLDACRREIKIVESYKRHKNAVGYVDSEEMASGPGITEILLLMDYCSGGHLVQVMNTRIGKGFSEREVLGIFSDVCEAVAKLHHRKPAIIHRDLKIENVLLGENEDYKLCDFGSATVYVTNPKEDGVAHVEDELQKYTTLAYRSPEMVDLYSGKLISTKADIWALGCLLYKICFFTNPFGESILSISNGSFSFPEDSKYSGELHSLIAYMLEPNPAKRPNIYQVSYAAFRMRGLSSPVSNYGNSSAPQSLPRVGLVVRPPSKTKGKKHTGLVIPTSTSLAPRERPRASPRASPVPQRRLTTPHHLASSQGPRPSLHVTHSAPANLSKMVDLPTSTLVQIDGTKRRQQRQQKHSDEDPFGSQPFNPRIADEEDAFGSVPFTSESKDLFGLLPFTADKKFPSPSPEVDCFGSVPFSGSRQLSPTALDPFGSAPFDPSTFSQSLSSASSSIYSTPATSPTALTPPSRGFENAVCSKPAYLRLHHNDGGGGGGSRTAPPTPVKYPLNQPVSKSASLNAISTFAVPKRRALAAAVEVDERHPYGQIASPEALRHLLGSPSSASSSRATTPSPAVVPDPPRNSRPRQRVPFRLQPEHRGLSGSLQDLATVIGNPAFTPEPETAGLVSQGHLMPPAGQLKKSRSQDFSVVGTAV
eukprot:m.204252 g.204252  ORF g.204252 m.204252 type:complete len:707 (+) comp39643_c0_seq33:118-2238(+)